jgi:hypothetical protein
LDENELDMQFDAMLNQIVEMRNTMEQLNLQKRLLERELRTASSEIMGRFSPYKFDTIFTCIAYPHFFHAVMMNLQSQTRRILWKQSSDKLHYLFYFLNPQ